jgi:hypothetical protein
MEMHNPSLLSYEFLSQSDSNITPLSPVVASTPELRTTYE